MNHFLPGVQLTGGTDDKLMIPPSSDSNFFPMTNVSDDISSESSCKAKNERKNGNKQL
jgi:hypothetical protein